MKEILLLKMGEIVLKGLNKKTFEDALVKDIKNRIKKYGKYSIKSVQSAITISPQGDSAIEDIIPEIKRVFGIARFSRAFACDKDMEKIKTAAFEYLGQRLKEARSFKVESKRSDKKFPLKSPEISERLGGDILEKFPNLRVDLHNPDIIVTVEVRDFEAYVRGDVQKGAGGIPCGTGGKAAVLISGGIDSPVASWMMSKRGVELTAVHFMSPPYTSERAFDKVIRLLEKVSLYSGRIKMFAVPFTKIQELIKEKCPEELFTLIMRRMMMRISEKIAREQECSALITGESLGQVASQTINAIYCTDIAASLPVFRPLIGMDKEEIISIARNIDTLDISNEPYEDCCTIFVPKHPRTRPKLKFIELAEQPIDWSPLITQAYENCKEINIYAGKVVSNSNMAREDV